MKYAIWVVTPEDYPHSACFYDQATPLQSAFADLGYEAKIVTSPEIGCRNIVLGAHLLPYVPETSAELVLYNLEQVSDDVPWISREYREKMGLNTVWDYSQWNIDRLAGMGVDARLLPVGYHPCMRNIEKKHPNIDVLHYGSLNQRRAEILQELQDNGLRVYHAFGVYGAQRDALVARSKIVLNVSYYESKIFNITRCSTLFANSVPVVSEIGPGSEMFHDTSGFAEYDGLVEKCVEVLANGKDDVGNKGFEIFSKMPQKDYLEKLL